MTSIINRIRVVGNMLDVPQLIKQSCRYSITHAHQKSNGHERYDWYKKLRDTFRRSAGLLAVGVLHHNYNGDEPRDVSDMMEEISHRPHCFISDTELEKVANRIDEPSEKKWTLISQDENATIYNYNSFFKVIGSNKNISARAFLHVHWDLKDRKRWDSNTVDVSVIGSTYATEHIRWIVKFSMMMAHREYIYARRRCELNGSLVMVAKTMDHPKYPLEESRYVRVKNYRSELIVRPHTSVDQPGFDYHWEYCDDVSAVPTYLRTRVLGQTLPTFMKQIIQLAKEFDQKMKIPQREPYQHNPLNYS